MPVTRNARGLLELGGVSLQELAIDRRIGTPAYVYDLDAIVHEATELKAAFGEAPHLVAYAIKANSAGAIVKALIGVGCGVDVVSGGELALALAAGARPDTIVFSGVAKTDAELDAAIGAGTSGVGSIQVESVEELPRIAARARVLGRAARVSLRMNPSVHVDDLDTHDYIATGHDAAKFGIPLAHVSAALDEVARASELRLVGIGAHVGSQLTSTEGYLASAKTIFTLARAARERFPLTFVDTGGGFGIDYGKGCPVRPAEFVTKTLELAKKEGVADLALYCEPGRSLVGAHGVLLASVVGRKHGEGEYRWLMIDAGMNDLMRPALYQARHRVEPLTSSSGVDSLAWKVVGPVCESSDDFGLHDLPATGFEHVALLDAGAYGFSMASRYNGRPAPAEVFLSGGRVASITPRPAVEEWVRERLASGSRPA